MIHQILAIFILGYILQFALSFMLEARHPAFNSDPFIHIFTDNKKGKNIFVKYYASPYLLAAVLVFFV